MNLKANEEKLNEIREIIPGSCQDIYGGVNKAQKKEDLKKKTEKEGKKKEKNKNVRYKYHINIWQQLRNLFHVV